MFTVRWKQSALNELAALWNEADSEWRRAITAATRSLDLQLQTDPHLRGESRPGGRRILFVAPLGVLFKVYPGQALIRVLQVWRY